MSGVCDECGGEDRHVGWCSFAAATGFAARDYTEPTQRADVPCPTCNGSGMVSSADVMDRLNRPGRTGGRHPVTSRVAGTTPRKGSQRLAVLEVLWQRGPLTARAIADQLDRSPNQTATRLQELHEDGFVEHVYLNGRPQTAETTPGNTGRLHRLTPLGGAAYTKASGHDTNNPPLTKQQQAWFDAYQR